MKHPWLIGVLAGLAFWGIAGIVGAVSGVWHPGARDSLTDPNPAVRAAAVRELKRDGNEQLLIDRLKDDDADVRLLAVQRLGERGLKRAERAAALFAALKDDDLSVRREAAWSLGGLGPDAEPLIQQAEQDEDPRVREGARLAAKHARDPKERLFWHRQE